MTHRANTNHLQGGPTAEPIRNGAGASGKIYLRRGVCWNRHLEETVNVLREELCCSRISGRTHDPCGRFMMEQSVPKGLHHTGETHTGAVNQELQPHVKLQGRTHVKLMEDFLPWEGPHNGPEGRGR